MMARCCLSKMPLEEKAGRRFGTHDAWQGIHKTFAVEDIQPGAFAVELMDAS